jgi:5TMR of 5TMR-LYT.
MIIKDLVLNLSLLISVSVFSEFIERAENKNVFLSKILEGLLFGLAAVISMSFAYVLYDGVIFDGRSVAISISALFFGPIAGLISTLVAVAYRLELGGTGTAMGLIFSTVSYVVGIGGRVPSSNS